MGKLIDDMTKQHRSEREKDPATNHNHVDA
jgi:hypothetical protein